ncbi:MAG: hypothetical protein CL676_09510 [Bdellovibrionaceae bacterium]|nr:hypothetical protein [Pseudobdellovibrionaceae bacterium]|tara:strand:+ start:1564 stop:1962 length:399 start_codon:yes stop_codon:yes gene_type:complete
MEKISGIVGASPRLQSGDAQNAQPARPGAPSFGRPIGEVTLAQRKDLSTAQKAVMLRDQMMADKKAFREQRAVQEMADRFFNNKVEDQLSWKAGEAIKMPVPEDSYVPAEPADMSPEEQQLTPKGSYINKSA